MKLEFKTPLNDFILIETQKTEDLTKGGIIIPDSSRENSGVGEVLEVSPDLKTKSIKKGDTVFYRKNKVESVEDEKGKDKFKTVIRYSELIGKV